MAPTNTVVLGCPHTPASSICPYELTTPNSIGMFEAFSQTNKQKTTMWSQPPPLIQRSDHNFHHLNFIREYRNRKAPSSLNNSSQACKYLPIIVCCFPLIVLDVLLTVIISQDWSLRLMLFNLYILTWERGNSARMYCQWEHFLTPLSVFCSVFPG